MKKIPSAAVIGVWNHLSDRYRTTIHDKRQSLELGLVGWLLHRFGILSKSALERRFSLTIGDRIYISFKPGEAEAGRSLVYQLATAAREHERVAQQQRDGKWRFYLRYLLSRKARCRYEAEAMLCDVEIYHWLTGQIPIISNLVARLSDHGCLKGDLADVAEFLTHAAVGIRTGGILSDAGLVAIEFLNEHYPELKHRPEGVF